jgi:hypothetical protein
MLLFKDSVYKNQSIKHDLKAIHPRCALLARLLKYSLTQHVVNISFLGN